MSVEAAAVSVLSYIGKDLLITFYKKKRDRLIEELLSEKESYEDIYKKLREEEKKNVEILEELGKKEVLNPQEEKEIKKVLTDLYLSDQKLFNAYIEFKNVKKIYKMGDVKIRALNGVDFKIDKGEFAVVLGPSGAGKSTILNILGGMDTCTTGEITVDGKRIDKYNSRQLTAYRRYDIGFVFQFYNLVQNLTVKENVELATQICKDPLDIVKTIEAVGLSDRMGNFPSQLSGGEQQRVAIARALAKNPKMLLCDEPTGALDINTGKNILKLLSDMCRKNGITVVVITHNQAISAMGDKVIKIKNGIVDSVVINDNPVSVDEIDW